MSVEEYMKEKLWPILIETVHASVMYPTHKAYTRETILQEKPEITASELANRLNMSLGEALVILHELAEDRKSPD
ncbi:winged helix-turn-helix domain-containing protein [Candidatus Bathyarchaeota archaeon]|nr:winged helix-turn-helix domain-containing protein [Candidatus Bathyarchaeota archaeon]